MTHAVHLDAEIKFEAREAIDYGFPAAILLHWLRNKLYYWAPDEVSHFEGRVWFHHTAKQIAASPKLSDEQGRPLLSEDQVRRTLRKLVDDGVVLAATRKIDYNNRTLSYSVNEPRWLIKNALKELPKNHPRIKYLQQRNQATTEQAATSTSTSPTTATAPKMDQEWSDAVHQKVMKIAELHTDPAKYAEALALIKSKIKEAWKRYATPNRKPPIDAAREYVVNGVEWKYERTRVELVKWHWEWDNCGF